MEGEFIEREETKLVLETEDTKFQVLNLVSSLSIYPPPKS